MQRVASRETAIELTETSREFEFSLEKDDAEFRFRCEERARKGLSGLYVSCENFTGDDLSIFAFPPTSDYAGNILPVTHLDTTFRLASHKTDAGWEFGWVPGEPGGSVPSEKLPSRDSELYNRLIVQDENLQVEVHPDHPDYLRVAAALVILADVWLRNRAFPQNWKRICGLDS